MLLALVFRQLARTQAALENIFKHIDLAILVLQAMDDCLVARNAAAIIRRTLARAKKVHQPALRTQQTLSTTEAFQIDETREVRNEDQQYNEVSDFETSPELDWFSSFPLDPQQAMFWTEWSHEVDLLGT